MREPAAGHARAGRLLIALGFGLGACSTDTTGLARREPEASPGGSANGPGPGAGGAGGAAGTTSAEGGAPPSGGSPGIGTIAVVHGVVDGGRLFACFRDVASGQPLADGADASAGVAYGQSFGIPTSWDVSSADVQVELFIASDASAASCSELRDTAEDYGVVLPRASDAGAADAGAIPAFPVPPEAPRRAGSLRLAPGVLRAGSHYALVAAGCTGPGGGSSEDVCGPLDSLFESQQGLVLAEISGDRSGQDGVGLQFLNASRAVSRADLVLQGNTDRESIRLSSDVQFGAVRPESSVLVAEPLGLELHVEAATQSSFTQPWSDALAGGEAAPGNYLVVYVGPDPDAFLPEGVASPRFVLVFGRPAAPPE